MPSQSIETFLEDLAARQPTPGGGAAAGLVAAVATSLFSMVANYTMGGRYQDREEEMRAVLEALARLRVEALQAMDDDAEAFGAVGTAYAMPRETDADKQARTAAIQVALVGAAEPPLAIARICAQMTAIAQTLADKGNPNVVSDVGVGAASAVTAIDGALLNVAINAAQIVDETKRQQLYAAIEDMETDRGAFAAVFAAVRQKLESEMDIDGRAIAASMTASVVERVAALKQRGTVAKVGILVATSDESTAYYVRSIQRAAERAGITAELVSLPDTSSTKQVHEAALALANDPTCHGIIAQTPFPDGVDAQLVVDAIPVEKDVDGATALSSGRLMHGLTAYPPATAQAVMEILLAEGVALLGVPVVVVGRSLVVGKPLGQLLLAANATVTTCHSRTVDLPGVCRSADVVIAAVGRAGLVDASYVHPGAVVIDVGTNATESGLVGDVDYAAVAPVASKITPVPGGVGPVTTACLLRNIVSAAGG